MADMLILDGTSNPTHYKKHHAGLLSKDGLKVALTDAALNDHDFTAGNVHNAYFQAPSPLRKNDTLLKMNLE